ncbi:MAG: DinB family protein [Myxococcota bacterium]
MDERERFVRLYRSKVDHTLAFLRDVPDDCWAAVYGSQATVGQLANHLVTAERFWFAQAGDPACGEMSAPPAAKARTRNALITTYEALLEEATDTLVGLSETRLHERVRFAGRRFTTLAFCWGVLAHHSFHLGQMDVIARTFGVSAIAFQPWGPPDEFVG